MNRLTRDTAMMAIFSLAWIIVASAQAAFPDDSDLREAMQAGDLEPYHDQLAAALQDKTPADPSRQAIAGLLADEAFARAAAQHQLLNEVGPRALSAWMKANDANRDLLRWVMGDRSVTRLYLLGGEPADGRWIDSLTVWREIDQADAAAREGINLRLAVATALAHAAPITCFGDRGVIDPIGRYHHFKSAHLDGELFPSFGDLSVWEYRMVVNSQASDLELSWARQMLRTLRPDLVVRRDVATIIGEVHRKTPDWGRGVRTFPKIIRGGGKCGPRSWFTRMTNRAFGIPTWGIRFPGHAATGYLGRQGWRTIRGGAFEKGFWEGRSGADFLAEAAFRSHAEAFQETRQMRWIAAAMGNDARTGRLHRLADAIAEETAARPPLTRPRIPGDLARRMARASDESRPADRPGLLHIEAEAFESIEHAQVHPCLTGGRQVYMPKYGERWGHPPRITYELDVPEAGGYDLTLRVAAVNHGQVVRVAVDGGRGVDVPVPYTRGVWGNTAAVRLALTEGRHTLTLTRPRPQRGLALRWCQLQHRGSELADRSAE